jgi:hypothetical protein
MFVKVAKEIKIKNKIKARLGNYEKKGTKCYLNYI